jgi:hypothetical protein
MFGRPDDRLSEIRDQLIARVALRSIRATFQN